MDILNMMTKAELVHYIKTETLSRPRLKWLYGIRWEMAADKVSKKWDEHLSARKRLDLTKRDEYAQKFNETNDIDERIRLAKLMKPYDDEFSKHLKEGEKLMEEDKKVDALWKKYEKAK